MSRPSAVNEKQAMKIGRPPHTLRGSVFCLCLLAISASVPLRVSGQPNYSAPYTFITLAGNAGYGAVDGTGSTARFGSGVGGPFAVAVDTDGTVYVADAGTGTIRKGFPAASVPAPVLHPPGFSADEFGFGITGLPGLAVDIESSIDLAQWQWVGTYILEGGTNYFVSPTTPQETKFYRGRAR